MEYLLILSTVLGYSMATISSMASNRIVGRKNSKQMLTSQKTILMCHVYSVFSEVWNT